MVLENKSYSQFGEDIELADFFGNAYCGYYVDVGANDGLRDSNTALLEARGWKGVLVEANGGLAQKAARHRPNSKVVHAAVLEKDSAEPVLFYQVSGESENLNGLSTSMPSGDWREKVGRYGARVQEVPMPVKSLESLFLEHSVPNHFDLLSVDVEGVEMAVLKGLDWGRWHPRLIILEDNHRNCCSEVRNFLAARGYIRVHRTGVNDWYCRKRDKSKFFRERIFLWMRLLKWKIQDKML